MEIRDLRVGNYLTFKGSSRVNVKLDRFDLSAILCNEDEVLHYEPIELTEEVLLKCGFVPCSIIENNFNIKGMCIWKCNDMFLCDKNGVHIKHLHQLQNLYYALCNEELNVQL